MSIAPGHASHNGHATPSPKNTKATRKTRSDTPKLDDFASAMMLLRVETTRKRPTQADLSKLNTIWKDGLHLPEQQGRPGTDHWIGYLRSNHPDRVEGICLAIDAARMIPDPPGAAADGDPELPIDLSDRGNAARFVRLHGDNLRYCHPWTKWLAWDGGRWKIEETGLVVRKVDAVLVELHGEAENEPDPAQAKGLKAWARSSQSRGRIDSMINLARNYGKIPVMPDAFDQQEFLLNCSNGTVDLTTGNLRPHAREDLLMKQTTVAFDPTATCPTWDAFLDRIMASNAEMIAFLGRAVGYAATASVRDQCLFFLHGNGNNGKSTFLEVIQGILGDYGDIINADLLIAKPNEDHPTGLSDLRGRRFVATEEVDDGKRLAESLIKNLTGNKTIRARRMREDYTSFPTSHKLFLAANSKPVIRGTDNGIWRRIRLIPFEVTIPDTEVDKKLPDKLQAEAPGIMAWIIRGCLEWQRLGLAPPAVVVEATKAYRSEMDYFGDFLSECCEVAESYRGPFAILYAAYRKWCETGGFNPITSNKFGRNLTERGYKGDDSNGVAKRFGIRLREEHLPDEPALNF